jgi:transcriptional regulator
MSEDKNQLLPGTLDLLVLKTLSMGALHGWGLAQRIVEMAKGAFEISQGSLYPALQRLKRKGWVASEWSTTENNRRARYYLVTPAGERQLGVERESWERSSGAVNRILAWGEGS